MPIEFSIIIPHKNSLQLLKRCISTIPHRDDVEVIVVDDDSLECERPSNLGDCVKVIHLTRGISKGAGRARNVGISQAQGKWILFADADDYYTDNLSDFLDNHINTDADVVYYNCEIIDERTKYIKKQQNEYSITLKNSLNNKDLFDKVKYLSTMPWNKLVSKQFLIDNNITFEEVVQGNDIYFSYQVGFFAKKAIIDPNTIYNYFFQNNTTTNSNWNSDKFLCFIIHIYKTNAFKTYIGHKEWHINPLTKILKLMLKNYEHSLSFLWTFIKNYKFIKNTQNEFVELITNRI